MKTLATLTLALLFTICCFAQKMQEKNVPANVKSAFKQKYPEATSVKWDKEDKTYEASFKLNNINNSVLMDIKANILETEVETTLQKVQKEILAYVKNNYAGKKPKAAAIITDNKGIVTYEIELKGMDLIFDSNGKFIKKVKA